ncbi:TPA: transcriptional regulator [Escherichia coli]|nr:transcriptional regulator [Escherichia coli]HBE6120764.1 transcriptional regulator [Escherichia coli]HBE6157061.1 transcriptional regulator [Escherichia coli]HBE6179460.1 transcriptional regulator [Escherichia coli]HBE6184069.1 transcriptional regulator [Escherichia coli]
MSAQSHSVFFRCNKKGRLTSSSLTEEQFWMFVEISPLHSEKVICALRDFLVLGYARREVCHKYNVSLSYFSIALGRISHVVHIVSLLFSYYNGKWHVDSNVGI